MTIDRQKQILAGLPADKFVGRTVELDAVFTHSRSSSPGGMYVLSSPGVGATEFLRQVYDGLFAEHSGVIPFYFEIRRTDMDAAGMAHRFARAFLTQAIAYRRNDPSLLNSSLEISELAEMAKPSDGAWISRIAELCEPTGSGIGQRSIGACLSGPARAAAHGARVFAIIDSLHETVHLPDGDRFVSELEEIFSRGKLGFIFGSRRRFDPLDPRRKVVHIEPLSLSESGELAQMLSSDLGVEINDQTRDLIGVQLQGNPARIASLFAAAAVRKADLNSFRQISSVYSDEILSGRIGATFDSIIDIAAPDSVSRRRLLEFLLDSVTSAPARTAIDIWRQMFGMPDEQFGRMIEILDIEEVIHVNSNTVEAVSGEVVTADCVVSRYMLEVESRSAAAVKAEILTQSLKRAPRLMARLYRKSSSLGICEMLSRFDCQQVPAVLFDYGRFRDAYKGRDHKEIVINLYEEESLLTLPQIVYADSAASFNPSIAAVIEDERTAVATGFSESKYTDDDQIAWVAAEIDSKLEAGPELVEQWCDRLEAVAAHANFDRRQIWLIAPEGFSPQALDLLRQRNAYGSSRQQAILLNRFLDPSQKEDEKSDIGEYEIVVPMGEDTELIAAHAVEEVARRHHFPQKAINQIKTALVEACINAAEHSLSPDRRIYQKFAVEADKINITVSNRGLRLADARGLEVVPTGGRRGWGLSLMRGLMDEVRIEQVDDGTRIRMTKFLKPQDN